MRILIVVEETEMFHLDALRESGQDVPPPKSYATYVEVAA